MKYYRYTDSRNLVEDKQPHIILTKYPVIKHTPAGVVISVFGKTKFILSSARKKWAYATIETAWIGFIKRKQSQLNHVQRYYDYVMFLAENLENCKSHEDYCKNFVEVTFFIPTLGAQKEYYDLTNPSDSETFDLNQELYSSKIKTITKLEYDVGKLKISKE